MNILVACEFSGRVRDAFAAKGHNAYSCDLLPSETEGNHILGDVRDHLHGWDLMIAHPPCTYLCNAGVRYIDDPGRRAEMYNAIEFFLALWNAPVPAICIENPIMHPYAREHIPVQDQVIQPWQFGHGTTKATGLWLKNLPKLVPTYTVARRAHDASSMPETKDRWKKRSRTYYGIAKAMADQWGHDLSELNLLASLT